MATNAQITAYKAVAQAIKNATAEGENTADKVGGLLYDIVSALVADETTKAQLKNYFYQVRDTSGESERNNYITNNNGWRAIEGGGSGDVWWIELIHQDSGCAIGVNNQNEAYVRDRSGVVHTLAKLEDIPTNNYVTVTVNVYTKAVGSVYLEEAQPATGATLHYKRFRASGDIYSSGSVTMTGGTITMRVERGSFVSLYSQLSGWGCSSQYVVRAMTDGEVNLVMLPIGDYVALADGKLIPGDYDRIVNGNIDDYVGATPVGIAYFTTNKPAFVYDAFLSDAKGRIGGVHSLVQTSGFGNENTVLLDIAIGRGVTHDIRSKNALGQMFLPSQNEMDEIFHDRCDTSSNSNYWLSQYDSDAKLALIDGDYYLTSTINNTDNKNGNSVVLMTYNNDDYEVVRYKGKMYLTYDEFYCVCRTVDVPLAQTKYTW